MASLNKENTLQREAFEIYYKLGKKRSLKAVAEQVNRTERTVAGWSRAYNWVDRCYQREIEEAKKGDVSSTSLSQTTDVKTRYRIIINNFMVQLSKDITDGKLKIKNVADYERLVKLDLLLMGEVTDKTEVVGNTDLSQEAKNRLDEIVKLLSDK